METNCSQSSTKSNPSDDSNYYVNLLKLRLSGKEHSATCCSSTGLNLNTSAGVDLFEVADNAEALDVVLQQKLIDVNMKDSYGRTLLLRSVDMLRSDSCAMRLLKANCDPNISNNYNETPLYIAAKRHTITVAHELIKRGADVNALNKEHRCPLHQAANLSNLETICLLLYYGADVNVLSIYNKTPFIIALSYGDVKISEILIDYYDNDDCMKNVPESRKVLYYAMQRKSPLTVRLVEMGTEVNYVSPSGKHLLLSCIFYFNGTLFKLMWARYDHKIILNRKWSFLLTYIKNCHFTTCDWVDCLRLILNSHVGFELVQHYNQCVESGGAAESGFFQELLGSFYRRNVKLFDRLEIIYIALNLGAKVNIRDIVVAYALYGFNDELEIFIYFLNCDDIVNKYHEFKFLLIPFILGLQDDFDLGTAQIVCQADYVTTCPWSLTDDEHDWVGFFTRQCYVNLFKTLPAWWISHFPKIDEKLELVPEFPSLFELSRTEARRFIRRACKVTRPYEFHDAVKRLNLPQSIKDVIRFKVPIYL